jgi:hypothetical protein
VGPSIGGMRVSVAGVDVVLRQGDVVLGLSSTDSGRQTAQGGNERESKGHLRRYYAVSGVKPKAKRDPGKSGGDIAGRNLDSWLPQRRSTSTQPQSDADGQAPWKRLAGRAAPRAGNWKHRLGAGPFRPAEDCAPYLLTGVDGGASQIGPRGGR